MKDFRKRPSAQLAIYHKWIKGEEAKEEQNEDKKLICEVLTNLKEYNYGLKCDTKQAVFSFMGS